MVSDPHLLETVRCFPQTLSGLIADLDHRELYVKTSITKAVSLFVRQFAHDLVQSVGESEGVADDCSELAWDLLMQGQRFAHALDKFDRHQENTNPGCCDWFKGVKFNDCAWQPAGSQQVRHELP